MSDPATGSVDLKVPAPMGGMSRSQRGGWSTVIRADHLHCGELDVRGHIGPPTICLELHEWEENRGDYRDHLENLDLSLTSGEARTLARQLEHMADRIDLHI